MRSAFGSIDKVNKRYRFRWRENGKTKSRMFNTLDDASQFQAQKRIERGCVDSSITFKEYYYSAVVPSMSRLAKKTKYEYNITWKRISPYIANKRLCDANRRMVQSVVDAMPSAGAQRNAIVLIRKICNLAIADDIMLKNPVTRHIQRDKEQKQTKVLYDTAQLRHALDLAQDTEFALPLLFCSCCGMRPEEAFAIKPRDVDFKNDDGYAFITIDKALTIVNGKKVLKDTKNVSSNRVVALSGDLVDYLTAHSKYCKNWRYLKDAPVPYNVAKRWRKFCADNDIPYMKMGDMRSCYATLCAEAGCLDSIVSQAMGHSGHSMKERNYQSMTFRAMKMNADGFSEYLGYKWKDVDV